MTMDATSVTEQEPQEARPRRWRPFRLIFRGLVVAILLLGVACWTFPWWVAGMASDPQMVNWLHPDLGDRVSVGRASLDWASPVLLRDVEIRDESGKRVAVVSAVTSGQTLWEMISRKIETITLELEGLEATVVVPRMERQEDQTVRLDRFIESVLTPKVPVPDRPMQIGLRNSTVRFVDASGGSIETLERISGRYECTRANGGEQSVRFSGFATAGSERKFEGEGAWQAGTLGEPEKLHFTMVADSPQPAPFIAALTGESGAVEFTPPSGLSLELNLARVPGETVMFVGDVEHAWKPVPPPIANEATLHETGIAESEGPATAPLELPTRGSWSLWYGRKDDRLQLQSLKVTGPEVNVDLSGSVERVHGEAFCKVTGQLSSDLAPLLESLPPDIRQEISYEDVRLAHFSAEGRLHPTPSNGKDVTAEDIGFRCETQATWNSISAFGLDSPEGLLEVRYQDGEVSFSPRNVPVGQGRLASLPSVQLAAVPAFARTDTGVILENVALSEEIVRSWLKFVSPIMANGTAVNGRFTLEANRGQLPFTNLHEAEVEGRLLIHEATVAPGPLMQDVIDMVNQLQAIVVRRPKNIPRDRALLQIEDQAISYRLSRGRVHHEEIRFRVGGITLTSSGSVGLDETVDLVVQIPLPESWLTKSPLLQSLQGEAVPLVITGTLSRPAVDGRVLGDFGKRIGAKAAGGLLLRILEKAGDR